MCALVSSSTSLLGVAWSRRSASILPHEQVGPGGEELGPDLALMRPPMGKVGICLVVAAEHGGETAEVVADRAFGRSPRGRTTDRPTGRAGRTAGRRTSGPGIRWRPRRRSTIPVSHIWSRGRSKSGAANSSRRRRASSVRSPSTWAMASTAANNLGVRGLGGHLLDERDQIAQGSALPADDHELCAEEHGGVGLTAVGADLERLGGQLLGPVGVAGDQGPGGTPKVYTQFKIGWSSCSASARAISMAAVHLVDIPGMGGASRRATCRPEEQHRVTDPLGPGQGVGRPGQGLLEQRGHLKGSGEWLSTRTMMASSPDDSAMARASSARAWRRSSGLPWASSEHRVASTSARSGSPAGKPVEGHLQDLDLVGVDGPDGAEEAAVVGQGGGHQSLGVAEIGRPASSVEEGVAKGRVTRLALGGAEPDGQVDAEDRIGVVGLGVEVEGLGVVAQGVGGGEGTEGGVARLAGVADGLGQVDGLGGAEPVTGQFAHPGPGTVPAEVLQGFGHLPVRPGPAGGTQVLVQGVLDEGVGEVVVPGASASSRTRAAAAAASRMSSSSSSVVLVARARRSRSKSRPMTAATDSTRPASCPSRPTRAPITSRTLSGRAICSKESSAVHRPSASW